MVNRKDVPWFEPYITNEDVKAVSAAVKFSEATLTKYVTMFEQEFAEYLGCKHAIAVMNGTCAIHLALLALDIKPKDEVITTSFTFIGTTNPILYLGAKPVFVDIDPRTYNIDSEKIEDAITPRTKAIIPVHMAGHPAEMDEIMEIAREHNLPVIEDAAEAHGATYKGRKAGSIGDIGCFSFACNKNMTTFEGGMVVTNDEEIAYKVRLLRAHAYDPKKWGTPDFFHHIALAYNYRMTDLQAALGLVQLKRLDWVNRKRKAAVEYYNKLFSKVEGIQTPIALPNVGHVYFMYLLRFADQSLRDKIISHLSENSIRVRVVFPPIHLQSFYKALYGYKEGSLPVTEDCAKTVLSIPLYPHIKRKVQKRVAEEVHVALSR